MQERRQAERIRLNLPARWQSLLTQDRGGICDLSASGCFVLTAGEVKAAELVRLEIDFGSHLVFAWAKSSTVSRKWALLCDSFSARKMSDAR